MKLLSDDGYAAARRYQAYDDFEEMPIHSTVLIDKEGRVEFLASQLQRMNQRPAVKTAPATGARK